MHFMKSLLFIEKVFLKKRSEEELRGVEVFNIALLRQLADLGLDVVVVTERSWAEILQREISRPRIRFVIVPNLGGVLQNGILAALMLARKRCGVVLLGNVANGLIPGLKLMFAFGVAGRGVLIANREASRRFLSSFRNTSLAVMAVNAKIADPFLKSGYRTTVHYGVIDAELYYPGSEPRPDGSPVNFCVVGQLDSAWKGADTAVAAFRALPEQVRENARLHLAAYRTPPPFMEKEIVVHDWMHPSEVPAFMRTMDVLMTPSRDEGVMRETFSQVIVQGMLTALPIIASDLPIFMEKLDGGGGLVCNSVPKYAAAMARLDGDAALRRELGAQARSVALERYVWNTKAFVDKYLFPSQGTETTNLSAP
jgi:glycosyltransferase involved in cell wall biosynthesis